MPVPTRDSRTKPLSSTTNDVLGILANIRKMAVNEQVTLNAGDTPILHILDNIYVPLVAVNGWWEKIKAARLLGGFNESFNVEVGVRFELGPNDYNLGNNRVQTGSNGFAVDDPVRFEEHDALPAPFAVATTYFVLAKPTTGSVTLSATVGGAELDITTAGTGVNVLRFALTAELNTLETAIEAVIDQVIADVPVTATTLEIRARTFNKALTTSTDGLADAVMSVAQTAAIRADLLTLQNAIEAPAA